MRSPWLLVLPVLGLSLAGCPSKPAPPKEEGPSADAGQISVSAAGIMIGKERLGDAPADTLAKIDPVFRRLKEQRSEWKTVHPELAFPGVVTIDLAPELTCQAAMSVYMSAMFAGYPHITVKQGAQVLDIPADVPKPPSPAEPAPNAPRRAFAVFHADGSVELKPSRCLGAYDSVPDAALAATVKEWCGAQGDCLGGMQLRCDAGVPMTRVMSALAVVRRSAPKMLLGTHAACKPGETDPDVFGGVAGLDWGKDSSLWGNDDPGAGLLPKPVATTRPRAAKAPKITVREGLVTAVGGVTQDEVSAAMKARVGDLEACYQQGLTNNPNLEGRVTVAMDVGKKGAVMSAKNGGSDLPDSAVVRCIVRAASEVTFPAKGALTEVRYPVVLQPR